MGLEGVSSQQLTHGWKQVESIGGIGLANDIQIARPRSNQRRDWLPVFRTFIHRKLCLAPMEGSSVS
jgi:hypothetical protein